jgi:hypothetical protein
MAWVTNCSAMRPPSRYVRSVGDEQTAIALEALSVHGPSLHRCDGTLAELKAYRMTSDELGWRIRGGEPNIGDLLVGVVGRSARRRVVNVNRVEGLKRLQDGLVTTWSDETDVPIAPTAVWGTVLDRMQSPAARGWGILTNGAASDFIAALCAELRDRHDVGEKEGESALRICRDRSTQNRHEALDRDKGICLACGIDLRSAFGDRGDRGLEVHHKTPLSRRPKGRVFTPLSDLIVLCATCHRLLHADQSLDLTALQDEWAVGRH